MLRFLPRLTVSLRLFLSFVGATAFTVLASLVAIQSFWQLREVLETVTRSNMPTVIAAFQLGQQAEATVASTPALATASGQGQRQNAYFRLRDQLAHLNALLGELRRMDGIPAAPLAVIEEEALALAETVEQLDRVVERKIRNERARDIFLGQLVNLRGGLAAARDEAQALLSRDTAMLTRPSGLGGTITIRALDRGDALRALDRGDALRALDRATHQANLGLDMLVAAGIAPHPHDLDTLQSAFDAAMEDAQAALRAVPEPAAAAPRAMVGRITAFGSGANSLFRVRLRELEALDAVEGLLARYSEIAGRLNFAASDLIRHQRRSVEEASRGSLELIRKQSVFLAVLALLCVIGSTLVAAYVTRSILSPLGSLERAMVAGAEGRRVRVEPEGNDEIAGMARALNVFTRARDEAERDLRAAKEQAEVANLGKTRFLAAASHDLRQPLQALGLFTAALGGRPLDPESRAILEKIDGSLEALEGLLESLLDISRLDAGIIAPERADFPAHALLSRMAAEFSPIAEAKGVRIRTVPTTLSVHTDPSLLERILRNLVSNAVRYTPKGRIVLGCRKTGETVRFQVWDTGTGIPEHQTDEIFQEFHQLDNPARDRNKGLGLGLAIVKRTAELLGHPLRVRSVPGKGSLFEVTVPMAKKRLKAGEDPRQDQTPTPFLGSRTVVVVDDDAEVRDALTLLLGQWGCQVIAAASDEEALGRMQACKVKPDAILADYRLNRGVNGDAVIARIRRAAGDEHIPGILITGDTAPERLRHARASGLPLLHKPVRPDKLYNALETALSQRQHAPHPPAS